MPRYDYQCRACGAIIEVAHSIRETPEVPCPACAQPMVRLLSGGDSISVEKGTLPSKLQHTLDKKNDTEMKFAKETVRWVKEVGQPATQGGLARPWPKPPKE